MEYDGDTDEILTYVEILIYFTEGNMYYHQNI